MSVAPAQSIVDPEPLPWERWPVQVRMIISAMDAGRTFDGSDRRQLPRADYKVNARLRLFTDAEGTEPWDLFVRDINPKGLAFVTSHRLPLGYGGSVSVPTPDGRVVMAHCTLLRCREAAPGWFEGAMYFNREQKDFAPLVVRRKPGLTLAE